jgi:hypothetical protein
LSADKEHATSLTTTNTKNQHKYLATSEILSPIKLTMFLLLISLSLALAHLSPVSIYNITIPSAPSPNLSLASFTTPSTLLSTLSKPKVHPINATVFDWWYFDAVSSSNPNVSVVITLFTSTPTAFPFLPSSRTDSVLLSYIWISFPNGTTYARYADASTATVDAVCGVTQGIWHDSGVSFTGSEEGEYEILIQGGALGVTGSMRLSSVRHPLH